jgi:indolepyruvate ferredoxin oxidoreductase
MAQVLGTAAYLDGRAAGIIDQAGLAQKGGGVFSHLRIAKHPDDIHAIRIPAHGAALVIGGDMVTVGSKKVLSAMKPGETTVVVNTHETQPGDFTHNADFSLPTERLKREIAKATDADRAYFVEATKLANALFGNSLGQNIFLVGYAWQLGRLPISEEAILKAIELNGQAVEMNKAAFAWGRRAVFDPASVEKLAAPVAAPTDARRLSQSLDERIERRAVFLADYQNAGYAGRYRNLMARVRDAERLKASGNGALAEAAAKSLFKLMSYKDEYEVARLFTDGTFDRQVAAAFEGDLSFGAAAEDQLRRLDQAGLRASRQVQIPARHGIRSVRPHRRALDGTKPDRRIRGDPRRGDRRAEAGKLGAGDGTGCGAREDPRFRAGQDALGDGGAGRGCRAPFPFPPFRAAGRAVGDFGRGRIAG